MTNANQTELLEKVNEEMGSSNSGMLRKSMSAGEKALANSLQKAGLLSRGVSHDGRNTVLFLITSAGLDALWSAV